MRGGSPSTPQRAGKGPCSHERANVAPTQDDSPVWPEVLGAYEDGYGDGMRELGSTVRAIRLGLGLTLTAATPQDRGVSSNLPV